jgi:hypothetical protein
MFSAIRGAIEEVAEFIDSSNRIYVTFNQPSYVGGDVVSGTVELDCVVPFFARAVLLNVKGFERVWWEYQVTEWVGEGENRRSVTRTEEHKENKEFFKQSIVVYPQQGTVAQGHYSFPFTYQLPLNLPGTYFEEGGHQGDRFHAKVLYKVKATVDVQHKHNLHSSTRLVVNEKFDQLLQPSYAENSKSFLTSSGQLHIRTWLDKNAYIPGETVLAKLKANNTSVKPTRRIKIKVHHTLELRAHGHTKRHSRVEYEQDFPGFEPCFYGINWMPFYIPVGLIRPSSLLGNHVHSSYLFEIECDIPGATDLSVKLPVRILAPQFLWSSSPQQPSNSPLPPTVLIRPPWQPDDQATSCNLCFANFSVFRRRHHCRHCAKVFCAKCVDNKHAIPKLKYKDPVRVCNACVTTVQSGGRKYQSTKEVMAAWYRANGMTPPGTYLNGASAPQPAV